jgi:hypothetical protein
LSLAIGKEGQNARLAAKLTGWRIDIKSESEAMKEGLDRLAAEQTQKSRSADLFSVVERFLQEDEQPPVSIGEDLLSKAARALENMEPRVERSETLELPSLDIPELPSERRDFRDLWPAEGFQMPAEPFSEAFNPEEEIGDREPVSSRFSDAEVELPSKPTPVKEEEEKLTRIDTLPEVITADMLRARKNKGVGVDLSADFVVPAELLVGMDDEEVEEEWDEDDDRNKGRGKAGPKAPAKPVKGKAKKAAKPETKSKGKKWRPPAADDEF